jgi:hypothetical protein
MSSIDRAQKPLQQKAIKTLRPVFMEPFCFPFLLSQSPRINSLTINMESSKVALNAVVLQK